MIRDENKNILKKFCYNYQGQVEFCSGISNTPLWQPTGSFSCKPCVESGLYYSNIQQRQEKDNNPNSTTYNTYRWVDNGTSNNCIPQADWQTTNTYCAQSNGQNTGIFVYVQKDMNPCSLTHNQTRELSGENHSACPPPGCNANNCTGQDKKCVNGSCETGIKVYTASEYNYWTGKWDCTYHYEWSDNSWSQNYVEESWGECPIW